MSRNRTYSPPTIISVPPTLGHVIVRDITNNNNTEASMNTTESSAEQGPVTFSQQMSSDSAYSNESFYIIHGNDDNDPPDYRHALQYRNTESNLLQADSLVPQPPPSYNSVN